MDQLFDGVEAPITEDLMQDPVLAQYQTEIEQTKWISELDAARKEREHFDNKGRKTIKRYADERDAGEEGKSFLNVFFVNTDIKMSALFARTPQPDIKRRFDDADDDVSRVAGTMLQRNLSYELEAEGFDMKFRQMLFDRLVPGLGVGWVRLEQDFDQLGSVTDENALIDHVAWDDFIWAPCRVWSMCRWVGRRIPMSKADIKQRFGHRVPEDVIANLAFSKPKENQPDTKDALKPKNQIEETVDVFEIWDKESRLVYWICESADLPLDVVGDTNQFPGFFPTPLPPLGRFTTSNTIPRSDYSMVQDQYRELDNLNDRCTNLIRAMRLVWAYDSQNSALKDMYSSGTELQGIPVDSWAQMMGERGGIQGAMQFAPLDEVAATYERLDRARDAVKAQINELEGIADAMRGATDRYVSAAATNQAGSVGASRIAFMRRDVADYIARLLRLKAHLICKFYQPQTILSRVGQMSQADTMFIMPALQLLANEQMEHFRLNVSVDSIQLENWEQDRQEKTAVVQALTQLLGQIFQATQQFPGAADFGAHLAKFAITGYRGSEQLEGYLEQFLQQSAQAAQQKSNQPPQPSPAQIKAQMAQQNIQAQLAISQNEEQTKRMVAAQDAQIEAARIQVDQVNAATKARAVDARIAHEQEQTRIDALDSAHQVAFDQSGLGRL